MDAGIIAIGAALAVGLAAIATATAQARIGAAGVGAIAEKPELVGSDQKIDMLLDVTLPISIELGRTSMPIEDILNLGPGSVVELNRLAGEPVDLLVNDKLIAKGEVVVVDENFGVRVTTMVSQEERLRSLV